MKMPALFCVASALFFASQGPALAGGQDFPFFQCSMQCGEPRDFILGPSDASPTGYALWIEGADASWTASPVSVRGDADSYFAFSADVGPEEHFEAVIPHDCGSSCIAKAGLGDRSDKANSRAVCRLLDLDQR